MAQPGNLSLDLENHYQMVDLATQPGFIPSASNRDGIQEQVLSAPSHVSQNSITPRHFKLTIHERIIHYLRSAHKVLRSPWTKCFLAWLFSLGLTAIIAIILASFDKKLYEDWHASITLNAMISILVTILYIVTMSPITTCIAQLKWNHFHTAHHLQDIHAFDHATQSVWGGLKFLLAHTKSTLGVVATLLTLIVTAIGPFFQQIIMFKSTPYEAGYGQLPVATLWGAGEHRYSSESILHVRADIFKAVFAKANTSFDVAPTMDVIGNCSWDPYQTLAIRSECRDATTLLSSYPRCNVSSVDTHHFQCVLTEYQSEWRLPNNLSFAGIKNASFEVSASTEKSLLFKDKGLILSDFFIMVQSFDNLTLGEGQSVWNGTVFAAECILQIVTETFSSSYIDGILYEDRVQDAIQHNSAEAIMNSPVRLGIDEHRPYQLNSSCLNLASGLKSSSSLPPALLFCPSALPYQDPWFSSLPDMLNQSSSSLLSLISNSTVPPYETQFARLEDIMANVARAFTRRLRSLPFSRADWCEFRSRTTADYSNRTNIFKYFNRSMPFFMYSDDSSIVLSNSHYSRCINDVLYFGSIFGLNVPRMTVRGTLTVDKLTYDIQRGWIALPTSLLVCVLALIIATMIDTKRKKLLVLGDSNLATMIHGVDEDIRSRLLGFECMQEAEDTARHTLVRFDGSRRMLVEARFEGGSQHVSEIVASDTRDNQIEQHSSDQMSNEHVLDTSSEVRGQPGHLSNISRHNLDIAPSPSND